MDQVELEIGEWRAFVERSAGVDGRDVEELEDHLRAQIADLTAVGLSTDEALLVAVKRMGAVDELSREFAREHSGRLWKRLLTSDDVESEAGSGWLEPLAFAAAAALTIQVARVAAGFPLEQESWFGRNVSLFVLPFLAAYFARRRRLSVRQSVILAAPFLIAAVVVNVYPFAPGSSTEILVAFHLPVVLWFVVAYPYMGAVVRSHERRMDFVRFTGEWFIYYVLIALGGGVLLMLMAMILEPTGVDVERIVNSVLPSGAAGAVIVAAWLVESKQRVVENMAPVLTMLFTPLFALMLSGAAVVYAVTALGGAFDRELLGRVRSPDGRGPRAGPVRDVGTGPGQGPGWIDRIQLIAIVSALPLDLMVLGVMVARIGELGFTPNRAAALGLNLVLLVSLAVTAWLSTRFLTGHSAYHRLERWQTTYLRFFGAWAAVVVVIFPPLFSFS